VVILTGAFGNRLYFTLSSGAIPQGTEPLRRTVFLGSSDLLLNGFQWKKYLKEVSSGFLAVDLEEQDLVFSSFDDLTHKVDAFEVNPDLSVTAPCPLLEDAAPAVAALNLAPTSSTLTSASSTVTPVAITPQLQDGQITLQTITCSEASLCDGGSSGGCSAPASIGIRADASSGMITLDFATGLGCTYVIREIETLDAGVWADLATVVGDGNTASRTFPIDSETKFFQIVTLNGN